ncbi:phosphatidylinositol transporter [Purpureocillium lavendulum]|uniref:Phosphatidylinositol transporter n=1 Tax=Purpureocillium lavendulum TaxID=1247861 RepID=A0AB34G1R3_9HYPO|nr:phosphatidylinositol transporter [Purpureocillium lavendulum]
MPSTENKTVEPRMTAELTPAASGTAGPATRVKSSASTVSQLKYPRGHLGYLSPHEEDALHKFKEVLEERGVYKPGPPASHDDPTLLRFLRARRWVVEEAYKQFKDTEDWRAANNIDTLYKTIQLDAYEQSRRLVSIRVARTPDDMLFLLTDAARALSSQYPQWTGRRDRRGIPLYVFEIKNLDSKTVAEYERLGAKSTFSDAQTDGKTPPGLLRLFALYENLTRFAQPFCTQLTDRENPDVPITMSTNIVDISGVGLKQFWNLKGHMQAASQLATAHYPETLDRIFIIGAPFFFSTVWGWIKRWFDPITVSKIFVLGPHEVRSTLEAFIEPSDIPKKYGGELDYEFGQLGVPDPGWEGVVEWENGFDRFPTGPLLWEDVDGGERVACIAYGTGDDGEPRRKRVCTVPKTWPLDDDVAAPAQTNGETTATTTTDAPAAEVIEGTRTIAASETHDDGVQTDDTVTNGAAIETLKLDEKHPETSTPVASAVPTSVA